MNNIKYYNIFIILSTLSRNIIELFSSIILYKIGFNLKQIILFYSIYYLVSSFVSTISLILSNKIKSKYILIISALIYSYSFYYLNNLDYNIIKLIIFSILLAISNYTYHPLRHLYAIKSINKNYKDKNIASILIFNYIAVIIASLLGPYLTNINLSITTIILIIISIISIIPLSFIKNKIEYSKITLSFKNIPIKKLLFFIFEQFKVIFLILQPLYLYLYIDSNLKYVGIFNVILMIGSIIFVYFFTKSKKANKYFIYINTILCLCLFLKINIYDKNILLIIGIFEGIGIKAFEVVSTKNIYNFNYNNITSYLIVVEIIFCLISSLIFFIFYITNLNIRYMLMISIIGIFICGIIYNKIKKVF